ncbi:MAG: type IX secretion system protein PorQ [Flavobacteriales bacterium]|nr:type IX secretion system protein PorQ [Flavobacteriales bacterium]MBK6945919.1 type IX secretion system protein PorQ [Flavobacteriales bacterium]MBK7239145.1 type IX secretion system protein PorQ [Flavobacteriales bacterium]MBK7296665.1 type IX secretion system protein PorQ [Flavobacteriales bacterium]MBK9536748.1 type IX secretion system protein PorQ [Flavobacteriales bacterium]
MRQTITLLALILASTLTSAQQVGGNKVFRILDIPSSARAAALGGNYIAVQDNDLNLGLFNPALLNKNTGRQIALSYLPYFEGINVGYAAYSHHFDSLNTTFSGSVQYVNYGTFQRTDEIGNELGEFKAGEYVVQVGAAHPIDSLFSIGANLKFINSNLDIYNSTAWAADIGGVFYKKKLGLTVAAVLKNIGYQTSTYTAEREKLPFQVQLGITYKFKHAPFRLGLMMEQLQRWDLTYVDPNRSVQIDPTTGDVIEEKVTTLDKTLLHLVPSAEVLLSKNFMLRLAYNYRRRQELVIGDKPGAVGISFGLGLKVSKVHISYGFSQLHLAGISNTFSIAFRFADIKKAEG